MHGHRERQVEAAPRTGLARREADDRAVRPFDIARLQSTAGNAAASLVATGLVQRDDAKGATKTMELIFIITKPGDEFIKDMTEYTKTTLKGHEFREVANIDEICAVAGEIAKQGVKFSRIDIVSHGQTNIGGVGMTPKGEKWRYVKPDEVEEYSKKTECKALQAAMAPDAEVRFMGCYIGGVIEAGMAWGNLFNSTVKSTTGQMKIGKDTFSLGKKGDVKASKDVPADAQDRFKKWLLQEYKLLQSTGEAPTLEGEDKQVAYMKELFDQSGGTIRSRVVEDEKHNKLRPGEAAEMRLWKTSQPTH